MLRDVGIRYEWKSFNGSFMHENIYRQVGSPEVDAAWEALGVDCKCSLEESCRGHTADGRKTEQE